MKPGDRVQANEKGLAHFGVYPKGDPGTGTVLDIACERPWHDCVWVAWDSRKASTDRHMINREWLKPTD